jgi:hypothetical protein
MVADDSPAALSAGNEIEFIFGMEMYRVVELLSPSVKNEETVLILKGCNLSVYGFIHPFHGFEGTYFDGKVSYYDQKILDPK